MTADQPSLPTAAPKPAEVFFSAETLAILLDAQQKAYAAGAEAATKTIRHDAPHFRRNFVSYNKRYRTSYKCYGQPEQPPGPLPNHVPLKDRVEPGLEHLPKPLGKRGPSKIFKSWSKSEGEAFTEFIEQLTTEFENCFLEEAKVDKDGLHVDDAASADPEEPVAGPSGVIHNDDILTPGHDSQDSASMFDGQ
jgi:hypothetical protein